MLELNWGLIAPILILQFLLAVIGLISLVKVEVESVRGPKWLWAIIIVFGSIIGSICYFIIGRKAY